MDGDPVISNNGKLSVAIRPFEAADTASLVELFRVSVRSIAARDYTPSQLRAWAPDIIDEWKFAQRCASKSTWIAVAGSRIAGFTDIEPDGHIDMLYVHPDFERRGAARALLEHIECIARSMELRRLYSEASITARPVFEAMGYRVIVPQTITIGEQSMMNFRMEKRL